MMPTDKERRHLVASIACGLLASPSKELCSEDIVRMSFHIYDRLIYVDEERQRKAQEQVEAKVAQKLAALRTEDQS